MPLENLACAQLACLWLLASLQFNLSGVGHCLVCNVNVYGSHQSLIPVCKTPHRKTAAEVSHHSTSAANNEKLRFLVPPTCLELSSIDVTMGRHLV